MPIFWSANPDVQAVAPFLLSNLLTLTFELSLAFRSLIYLPWRLSCRSRFEVWSSTQLSCSVSRSFSSWWRSPLTLAWARRSRTSARRDWRSALNIWSNDAFWCASCSEPIGSILYKLKTMHAFCNNKSMIHFLKNKVNANPTGNKLCGVFVIKMPPPLLPNPKSYQSLYTIFIIDNQSWNFLI